ncbi:hypothetical protein EYF80_010722 [Liparis tanakae]|uniref:Uncharacterized protein n=1 Tax=Liparis tanakae TaxID=230148 RepID=A0A4Z2IPD9_9TELE|nr:hypothetical protein EYF80_010722 [Liparis tanakae]
MEPSTGLRKSKGEKQDSWAARWNDMPVYQPGDSTVMDPLRMMSRSVQLGFGSGTPEPPFPLVGPAMQPESLPWRLVGLPAETGGEERRRRRRCWRELSSLPPSRAPDCSRIPGQRASAAPAGGGEEEEEEDAYL